jgi:hypothetical protein
MKPIHKLNFLINNLIYVIILPIIMSLVLCHIFTTIINTINYFFFQTYLQYSILFFKKYHNSLNVQKFKRDCHNQDHLNNLNVKELFHLINHFYIILKHHIFKC